MDVSRARRRIRVLHERIGSLLGSVLARSPVFAASLYEHRSQCGRPLCKCAKGPYRHRLWCVSFVEEGRSRTRVVPKAIRPEVEKLTGDYRRFRQARRELGELVEELLAKVDAVGKARCEEGTKRYVRLVARAKEGSARTKTGG